MIYFILLLGDGCPVTTTEIDHWISCASVLENKESDSKPLLNYLDSVLVVRTWLCGKQLSLADIHMFSVLYTQNYTDTRFYEEKYYNLTRWYRHILSHFAVVNAISIIAKNGISPFPKDIKSKDTKPKDVKPKDIKQKDAVNLQKKSDAKQTNEIKQKQTKTRKQEGKFVILPGAEMGKVKSCSK